MAAKKKARAVKSRERNFPPPHDDPKFVTTRELAAALDISGQRIRQLTADGVIKCIKPNKYDVAACKSAYLAWKSRKKPKEGLDETKLRKMQAEAAILEHKLAVQKGEFVSRESMLAEGQKLGLVIRGMFQRVESDLTPRLAGRDAAEVSVILRDYMRVKLVELSQYESTVEIPTD